jgi:hypothetical protein
MRHDPPPGGAARQLIAAVVRRRRVEHAALAVLAAVAVASAVLALSSGLKPGWPATVPLAVVAGALAGALVMWRTSGRRSRSAAARAIEQADPLCRNVVITAEELDHHPGRTSSWMASRVFAEADRRAGRVGAATVVPLRSAWICLACAAAVVLFWRPESRTAVSDTLARAVDVVRPGVSEGVVRFTIAPPAYSERQSAVLTDPERLQVLAGSRIAIAAPAAWRVRFGDVHVAEVVARESGYFAVEDAGGSVLRLIPVTVTPDRAPVVRIEKPAKDLLLPDGQRSIPVSIRASDDLALSMLELRYTKVSGSGEQFEFVEGRLPVNLERTSASEWRADGALALAALNLGPGDSLVYRAVARDRRPGQTGLAASDTYLLEIAGPGQIALEGVDMPADLERYAMSQQMIVVKLERLKARAPAAGRDVLLEEAHSIAAEQRTVRANFIFLLGGHVEDEEEEAAQSHEIQEGRLENSARKDINAAISEMTRVEQALTAVDVVAALPPARAAVESLQRAFGRSRYLLRSLAARSRLDPGRRLTGELAGAADWRRQESQADAREGEAVRRLLDDVLLEVAAARAGAAPSARRRRALAEAALAIDPASAFWQQVAQRLAQAADAAPFEAVAADLSPLALRGVAQPAGIERGTSPLDRAFKGRRP